MALSKSYLSVNGELYAEWTEGVAKTEVGYIRDALGNVVETVNADGTTMNTYNYKPFGDVLSKTGVEPDPKYLWCGTWGYRASGNKWVSHYVRARHYSFADAAWTSVDPLWIHLPMLAPYTYMRPVARIDYWGLFVQPIPEPQKNNYGGYDVISGQGEPCIKLQSIEVAKIGIFGKVVVGGKFCMQRYDASCCSNDAATSCTWGNLTIGAQASLDPSDIFPNMSKQVSQAIKVFADMIDGFGKLMRGQVPVSGCPEKVSEKSIEVCISGCLVMQDLKVCLKGVPPRVSISSHTSFCGFPKVDLTGGMNWKNCQ